MREGGLCGGGEWRGVRAGQQMLRCGTGGNCVGLHDGQRSLHQQARGLSSEAALGCVPRRVKRGCRKDGEKERGCRKDGEGRAGHSPAIVLGNNNNFCMVAYSVARDLPKLVHRLRNKGLVLIFYFCGAIRVLRVRRLNAGHSLAVMPPGSPPGSLFWEPLLGASPGSLYWEPLLGASSASIEPCP